MNNKKEKKKTKIFKKSLLDKNFNLEAAYFEKPLSKSDWNKIETFAEKFLSNNTSETIDSFLSSFPNLWKGETNVQKLRSIFDKEIEASPQNITKYKEAMNYIIDQLYIPKPYVCQSIFFPGEENENKVVNMVRTCKYSLDICIFTMTNDKLFEAVEECWNANIAVRIITDDECVKQKGSDVYKLATLGIPVKTDSNAKYHMHHKFVIVDKKVLITGSFNWTVQAVKSNNENVLMIQNEQLVKEYIREFDELWKEFNEEITPEEAKEETKKNK